MTANKTRSIGSLIAHTVFVCVFAVANEANAITIRVPQDYAKITDALLWATNGDEIVVSPGVYVENINFSGKNVILRSTNPTSSATVAATIIDGNKKDCVVRFAGMETSGCLLSGFTIRNGNRGIDGNSTKARIERNTITGNYASGYGGGLYECDGTIQNNVIANNYAIGSVSGAGGGLYRCNGTIQNNVITGNSAGGGTGSSYGGGLCGCNGTIQSNTISVNSAVQGGGLSGCGGTIQNNVITSNYARGYYGGYGGGLYQCNGTIRNNTITSNSAIGLVGNTAQGGGLCECSAVIVNCIFWGNTAPVYPQISPDSIPSFSCIQGLTVQGNIKLNPRFVGPNNFHLLADSPCIDAGTNANCPATDKDGNKRPYDGNADGRVTCDMGAYEYVGRPAFASVSQRLWPLYK